MTVISLDQVRRDRAEHQAAIITDAKRLIEASTAYGHMLAGDAYTVTAALPSSDRHLQLTVERFFLRRGLTRSRHAWREEYGKERGLELAGLAAPIVRDAFWSKLDELNPLVCQSGGMEVPLIRGWAHRLGASA